MSLNAKMDKSVSTVGRGVMVMFNVLMDQTKKPVKITLVLRVMSNAKMENSALKVFGGVIGVTQAQTVLMDLMKKTVKITPVLIMESNAKMENSVS